MRDATLFPDGEPATKLVYNGVPPSRRGAPATSAAAALRMTSRAPSLRMKIIQRIRELGAHGATAEEMGQFYAQSKSLPPDTAACRLSAAARLTELKLGGLIENSGRTRATAGGSTVVVWVATEKPGDGRVCVED